MDLQITWGPLSFMTAILIVKDSPYRHPIQALVSTGQFYGDMLYYLTSLFDDYHSGKRFYRPEPYYFWFYFVFMNAFWLVIPACEFPYSEIELDLIPEACLYSSIRATAKAFSISKSKVENGSAKKNS